MNQMTNYFAAFMGSTALIGVLFHDMHLDRAASMALGAPIVVTAGAAAAEVALKKAHPHVHVDHVEAPKRHSIRTTPNGQPGRDDHKKPIGKRAHLHFGADNGVIWPSV